MMTFGDEKAERDLLSCCFLTACWQVAWLRAEPDIGTLLSVQTNVIANDPRLKVSHHNHQKWTLHIKDVMESDAG